MSHLLDPVAWERRLQEARARRAEALARRGTSPSPAAVPPGPRPGPDHRHGPIRGHGPMPAMPNTRARRTPPGGPPDRAALHPGLLASGAGAAAALAPDTAESPGRAAAATIPPAPVAAAAPATPAPLPAVSPASGAVTPAPPAAADAPAAPRPRHDHEPPRPSASDAGRAFGSTNLPKPASVEPARDPESEPPASGREAPETIEAAAIAPVRSERAVAAPLVLDPVGRASPRAARQPWSRARLAAVFVAGLILGLVAALVLSRPALDRFFGAAPPAPDASAADARAHATAEPADEPPASAVVLAPADGWEAATAPAQRLAVPLATEPAPEPSERAALEAPPAEAAPVASAPATPLVAPSPPDAAGPGEALPPLSAPLAALPATPAPGESAGEPAVPGAIATPSDTDAAPPAADVPAVALPAPPAPDAPAVAEPAIAEAPAAEELGMLAADAIIVTSARPLSRPAGGLAPLDGTPAAEAVAAVASPQVAEPAAEGPEAAASAAPFAAAAARRVLVHIPSAVPADDADRATAALERAGIELSGRVNINMAIGSTNVRYYFAEDADVAAAAARAIREATGQPAEARDFTSFRPRPAEGTVEVWLAGQPRSAPQAAAPQPAAPQAAAPQAAAAPPPGQAARQAPQRQPTVSPSDQAMRDLERLADEIARAIARSLRD